jgi:hypothetical protein
MIFSELYSAYYRTVAAILSAILDGEQNEKALQDIVVGHAFGESVLTILPALKTEKWQLVHADMTTPIRHKPTLPLTMLQKQWLKAISLDPRVQLFGVDFPDLGNVEPLFTPADYHVYDKYGDGDPYTDPEYIRQFRVILSAIQNGTQIKFNMVNRKGNTMYVRCRPVRLEYSEKDDKFRLITAGWRAVSTVNLAKMRECVPYTGDRPLEGDVREVNRDTLVLRVTDKRNALERVMLHFAHFEKQAERLTGDTYLIKIKYAQDDVSEMVIRVLSFGPLVEVTAPEDFRQLVISKLKKQKDCGFP